MCTSIRCITPTTTDERLIREGFFCGKFCTIFLRWAPKTTNSLGVWFQSMDEHCALRWRIAPARSDKNVLGIGIQIYLHTLKCTPKTAKNKVNISVGRSDYIKCFSFKLLCCILTVSTIIELCVCVSRLQSCGYGVFFLIGSIFWTGQ